MRHNSGVSKKLVRIYTEKGMIIDCPLRYIISMEKGDEVCKVELKKEK